MGWKHQDVLDILDGIAKPICHYKQPHGMCTGVCLEWLRRLLLKSDWPGIDQGNLELGDKAGQIEGDKERREEKKDARRLRTHEALYGSAKQAFETDLRKDPTRHKCVEEYTQLKKRWKGAKGDSGKSAVVRGAIAAWARKYKMREPPGIKDIGTKSISSYLRDMEEFAHLDDYKKWREEEPIEAGVLREISEEAEDGRFDPEGIALRARFVGMKVVEGANKSRIPASTTRAAAEQATRSAQFTVGRGMVFGLFGLGYKGEGHSLGMYRLHNDNYLWLDPNYGVWKMEDLDIHEAMETLFDKTGEPGEKGVYQEFGDNDPTGFEYTIWEKKAGYLLPRKVGSGQ
jgi:hypothetical protein